MAAVDNDAAQSRAVSSDEFGSRVHHHVSSVLNRTDKIGCAESIVHNEKRAVFVGDSGNCVEVGHITVWITECRPVNYFSIWPYSLAEGFCIIEIYNCVLNPAGTQVIDDEII